MKGTLLVATRNPGKLVELQDLFVTLGVALTDLEAVGIPETAEEDDLESFPTFEENALAKAAYFHDRTGLPTIADDSGLVVRALGGAPGVHSKRYSGAVGSSADVVRANNAKLMAALHDVDDRSASFVCAAAYVSGGVRHVMRGQADGHITPHAHGAGGFGYDPYFFADELGQTFGEASIAEKARVSHRARAFRALVATLAVDARVDGSPRQP